MTEIKTDLYLGDCLEILADFDPDSFDLIMTSPPYADRRSKTYGGISPDEYVAWFMPRAAEFLRVLKPSGTFILKVGSGFGKNVSNWVDRKMAYPTNVLHLATETGNRKHSAVFPKTLPEWFIKLFTKENDWVLDPFAGSGTTGQVAQKLLRNSVGIEILPEYYQLARENIKPTQYQLFEEDQNAIHYTTRDH